MKLVFLLGALWALASAVRADWVNLPDMPINLGEVTARIINKKMYVMGEHEHGASSAVVGKTAIYDISSGKWSLSGSKRPCVGDHHMSEVVGGKLYILGGIGCETTMQIYNPGSDSWSIGPDLPFGSGSGSTALHAGKIYVCGGIDDSLSGNPTHNKCARFSVKSRTWEPLPSMPHGVNHAAYTNNKYSWWIIGGRSHGNTVQPGFNYLQEFDFVTGQWKTGRPLPQARGGMGHAVYLFGKVFVFGGETSVDSLAMTTSGGTLGRVDVYNTVTKKWEKPQQMPYARHGIYPILYGRNILIAGGGQHSGYSNSNIFNALRVDLGAWKNLWVWTSHTGKARAISKKRFLQSHKPGPGKPSKW